jgi:hypothetical protein
MLQKCLNGYERIEKPHRWNVKFKGRVYHEIPLGKHGRRTNPEIETGHIRGLVKFFGIPKDCYEQYVNLK